MSQKHCMDIHELLCGGGIKTARTNGLLNIMAFGGQSVPVPTVLVTTFTCHHIPRDQRHDCCVSEPERY